MGDHRPVEAEGEDAKQANAAGSRSPIVLRKRQASSASPHNSLQATPYMKKTRELPNISNCHCCGSRCPDKGRNESLQMLDSQWRILLLCSRCIGRIRSATVCSYCFLEFSFEKVGGEFVDCRQCSCRVHLTCLPLQRGYILALDLDPCSFTCVDCCAMPRCFTVNRSSSVKGSCPVTVSPVSSENVVRDANSIVEKKAAIALKAKQKALEKAMAARNAAELARHVLDVALSASNKPPLSVKPIVADEELAFQLHLSMNGSQRISRSHCSQKCLFVHKRDVSNGSLHREFLCGSKNVSIGCIEVQVCKEDRSFETLDLVDSESVPPAYVLEKCRDANSDSWSKCVEKENKEYITLEEMPAKDK